jgi:hypothetical protein
MPPAKAKAKGRKPAALRACEIETRSASDGKDERQQHGREHRERAADDICSPTPPPRGPLSGTSRSAAIATALPA